MTQTDFVVLAIIVVAVALFLRSRAGISGEKARALVAGGAKLVDVRSPAEFAGGHLQGALNIPVGDIAARARELGAKDKTLVLYCASGMRSAMAASTLRGLGFSDVQNLGPMSRW